MSRAANTALHKVGNEGGVRPETERLPSKRLDPAHQGVEALMGKGEPLNAAVRADMEARFGQSFADVLVHDDPAAHLSAAELNARAYTVGNDIAFSAERYAPHSSEGRRLIAHELAHVVQQRRGGPPPALSSHSTHERAADHAAQAAISGQPGVTVAGATGVGIAREEEEQKKGAPKPPQKQVEAGQAPAPQKQLASGPITVADVMADPKATQEFHRVAAGTAGKVKDITNVQGAIFEEVMNREVERRIKSGSDMKALLPGDIDPAKLRFVDPKTDPNKLALGEAIYVKGDRIQGIVDKRTVKLSDGMILMRDEEGIRVVTALEGKSGKRRASDLHRIEAGKEEPSAGEKAESARVKAESKAGKVVESEIGGQVRKTVERLAPNVDEKTTDILVDGKRVAVRSSPRITRYVGVVPKDVDIGATRKALRKAKKGVSIDFEPLKLESTEADIKVAATKVAAVAQADKPWAMPGVKAPTAKPPPATGGGRKGKARVKAAVKKSQVPSTSATTHADIHTTTSPKPSASQKPGPAPAKPAAAPATPTPAPAKPAAAPATPTPVPAKPAAAPATPTPVPAKPAAAPGAWRPRLVGGARALGGAAAGTAAQLLAGYLKQKFVDEPKFEEDMRAMEPQIATDLASQADDVMKLQVANPGRTAYAHITVISKTINSASAGPGGVHAFDNFLGVTFEAVSTGLEPQEYTLFEWGKEEASIVSESIEHITFSRPIESPPFEDMVEFAISNRLPLAALKGHARVMLDRAQTIGDARIAVDQLRYWQRVLDRMNVE